jgi:hypothetical protein
MNDQRSLYDQLKTLVPIANKHGLYDAADWLKLVCQKLNRGDKGKQSKVVFGGKNQAEQMVLFEVKDND